MLCFSGKGCSEFPKRMHFCIGILIGSVDCATYASGGAFPTAYSKLVFDYILDEIITSSNYVVFAKSGETDGTCFYKNLDAGVQYGIAVLTDTDGDSECFTPNTL